MNMEAVLKCVECVAETMPQMEKGVGQFVSQILEPECLSIERMEALSTIIARLEKNIAKTNDVAVELNKVFSPLQIASSGLKDAAEKLLQSKQSGGNAAIDELKRNVRKPLFNFHDNAEKVDRAQFEAAIRNLDSLKQGWVDLKELVEKEISELEKDEKRYQEQVESCKTLRTLCYVGAGVTLVAGIGLSIFLICSSGGLSTAGEVAGVATAIAGTAAVAAGASGLVVGAMQSASVAGQAIQAAQKMIKYASTATDDYKKMAKEIGDVITTLESLKRDINVLETKIDGTRTAVTFSQGYHHTVKARLGMNDKEMTRDDIFQDLIDMDVQEMTKLVEELGQACSEEAQILAKLKEMSDEALVLQEKYVKVESGAPSLYDHREKLQKMVRRKNMV